MWLFFEQNKSTGELSFLTCLMNSAGSLGEYTFSHQHSAVIMFREMYWTDLLVFCSASFHQSPGKSSNKWYPCLLLITISYFWSIMSLTVLTGWWELSPYLFGTNKRELPCWYCIVYMEFWNQTTCFGKQRHIILITHFFKVTKVVLTTLIVKLLIS